MDVSFQKRKAIGRSVIATAVIVILVVVGVGAYYVFAPGAGQTTTGTPASGTLSLTFANVPNADPAKGSDEASSAALANLYDSLVFPTSSGTIQKDLATDWTVSTDGLTYTFTIRQGVAFHNGDVLTASDVVYSLNRLISVGQGYSYLFSPYVSTVTAPSSNTVVIQLKKTFGPFISALVRLYIVDQKLVSAHYNSTAPNNDYGSTWLLTHDAGSGAYQMASANLESNMLLQTYRSYWNGTQANQPGMVNMIGSSASATVQALFTSGQIQITDQWQPYSNVQTLSQLKGAKLVTIPTVNEFYLMIDTTKAPTDDIYVRQAMSYAFNYTSVIDNIFPGSKPSAGPVPSALPGHNPNIPASSQNLALAQQAIQKSKYYGKLSSYPVTYWWVTQVPSEQKMALEFASDMERIGITVNVVGQPWLTVVANLAAESTSPNVVSITDGASYFEAGSVLQSRYTSPSHGTWEKNEWMHNPTLDNMIFSALSTLDQTARFQQYNTIQQQIYNQIPTVYAFDVYEARAYYPTVVNWYAANGHPIVLLGYNFYFRDFKFYPSQLTALFG